MSAFDSAEWSDEALIKAAPVEWAQYIDAYRTTLRQEKQLVGDWVFYIPDELFDVYGYFCTPGYKASIV